MLWGFGLIDVSIFGFIFGVLSHGAGQLEREAEPEAAIYNLWIFIIIF